ncbi:MAG TPA: sigma-70 family RNA polymerase sigma factor [Nocardioidaceae bacterium]|nr:sigma-70 family RNA polymerase sigma factor [Nocardioidaceae bacterium]
MSRSRWSESLGLDALRCAVAEAMRDQRLLATTPSFASAAGSGSGPQSGSADVAGAEASRITALVDLARAGDADAFGALYDHYSPAIYRFVYYRVRTRVLAEDLTSETFFRALRSIASFQWQGKDFGAWLTTIARNLIVDHFKAGRTRLETTTDDFSERREAGDNTEEEVLAALTSEVLREAMTTLPTEQHECIVLRFLNGYSIAETATSLGRTEGAVKQLQLRAIRNLAKLLPEDLR